MASLDELRGGILFLAPGFVALRIYTAFAYRRPRSDWHWLVWSVIASLPIDFVARGLLSVLPEGSPRDLIDALFRALLALALGVVLCVLWRRIATAKRPLVRRFADRLVDSVWDDMLDMAHNEDRTVEVVTINGTRYVGHFRAGREDAGAEPWLFLTEGYWCRAPQANDWEQPTARGLLIHRDQIRQVIIQATPDERGMPAPGRRRPSRSDGPAAAPDAGVSTSSSCGPRIT